MVQETGIKPPSLTEEQLKKLLLEAIDHADDADNPETFHAFYDHPERGLDANDTIHGLERNWKFERPPVLTLTFGSGNTTSAAKVSMGTPSQSS
jgi:hypothetical protein